MKRAAVFLDLQGTLGGKATGDILDFVPFPFTSAALRLLNEAGIPAIILTNQSHIAKGLLTMEQYEAAMSALKSSFSSQGIRIDGDYCCPHGRDDLCSCKKPLPGMALQAAHDFDLDLSLCYVVGDMGMSDMLLAKNISSKSVLVLTGVGRGSMGEYRCTWADMQPDHVAENVLDAVEWIIQDIKA